MPLKKIQAVDLLLMANQILLMAMLLDCMELQVICGQWKLMSTEQSSGKNVSVALQMKLALM